MKNRRIRYFAIFILSLFIMGYINAQPIDYQAKADAISKKWVPDKREGICTFMIEKQSNNQYLLKGETDIPAAKKDLIEVMTSEGLHFTDSIQLLPKNEPGGKIFGIIDISVANMRKDPAHAAELVSQSLLGTPVKLIKKRSDWYLIQTPDKYLGWIPSGSVVAKTDQEMDAWKKNPRVIYLEDQGKAYMDIAKKQPLCDLVSGCIVEKKGEQGNLIAIVLPDGRNGYVDKASVKDFGNWEKTVVATPDKLYQTASQFMGIPYLWGGTSSKGFDCSGFVKTVYFLNGIILARDASLQFLHGIPVDISKGTENLRRGDLLFFGSIRDNKPRVTHVGMYIGNNEFIHDSERVRLNSFDPAAPGYSKRLREILVGARRVLGAPEDNGITPVLKNNWY